MKHKNYIRNFDDYNGMFRVCGIFYKKIKPIRPLNNKHWNDQIITKIHISNITASTNHYKILDMFLSVASLIRNKIST